MYKVFGIRKPCPTELLDFDEVIAKTNECKLKTCLRDYNHIKDKEVHCILKGHTYCYCDHCAKHPTCVVCRLFIQTGRYL